MIGHYILNAQGEPVLERNFLRWALWFERAARHVGEEMVGSSWVSTVFLGLDQRFGGNGPPILWETMVFGGKLNQEQWRCAGGREQAEAMHAYVVDHVRHGGEEFLMKTGIPYERVKK